MRPANVQAGCSVLVTGATGFTGGALARRLLREGHRVRLLVRSPRKAAHLEALGAEIVVGDICRAHDVTAATEGCQTVYHLAALYRSAKFPPDMYRRVNVEGTRNVLDAGRTCRVQRLVHCSTVGVHGEVKTIPADETAPIVPHDAYQRSKAEGERLAREAAESGLPVVIFRPCGIYGPGDLRFLKLFRMVLSRVRMVGTGNVYYHLTHINDLVNGILLCGRHPAAVGQTYLLAGPRYTTIDELVPLLAKAAGVPEPRLRLPLWPFKAAAWACQTICRPLRLEPPLYPRRLDFFCMNRAFSTAKARAELGYNPVVDLAEGLAETAAWYRQQGYLPRDGAPANTVQPHRPTIPGAAS